MVGWCPGCRRCHLQRHGRVLLSWKGNLHVAIWKSPVRPANWSIGLQLEGKVAGPQYSRLVSTCIFLRALLLRSSLLPNLVGDLPACLVLQPL